MIRWIENKKKTDVSSRKKNERWLKKVNILLVYDEFNQISSIIDFHANAQSETQEKQSFFHLSLKCSR